MGYNISTEKYIHVPTNTHSLSKQNHSTNYQKESQGFSFEYNKKYTFLKETECCICFEEYNDGMIMEMLPCNHVIHTKCLHEWYHKSITCPICRHDYSSTFRK